MTMEHRERAKELFERGFHLGGSRYMAAKYPNQIQINDNTDWDFYCEDTVEKRTFLSTMGFHRLDCENKNYWDNLLVDMYKHPTLPFEVLIRKDVAIYKSSVDALSAEVFIDRLWKSSPKRDLNIPKEAFSVQVKIYFNGIFALHGWRDMNEYDIPY